MGAYSPNFSRQRVSIETRIEMHLEQVELLLARLDRADAATEDLEDDDPGGTFLDRGEGVGDGFGVLPALPRYGIDQRRGPINHRHARTDFNAQRMGLVRSPSGGWRYPSI